MLRQTKTAGGAVGALVVAAAASLVPLVGPATGRSVSVDRAFVRPGPVVAATSGGASTATNAAVVVRPGALFLGDSPAWRPPGGAARSYVCRAAALADLRCTVASRSAALPATERADVIVLLLTLHDTAATVARALDALPAASGTAEVVVLAPVEVTTGEPLLARLPAIRRLVAARGATFVDPVAGRWITPGTVSRDLLADGVHPTPDGVVVLAARLARWLR